MGKSKYPRKEIFFFPEHRTSRNRPCYEAFKSSNWDIENREFNGRVELNCTEAQIMILAKFLNVTPTEGFDNFSVGEARDLIKSVWLLKGAKNVNSLS
jgi:hypothetical protein